MTPEPYTLPPPRTRVRKNSITGQPFSMGWHDAMYGRPWPVEPKRGAPHKQLLAYEHGRHAAALFKHDMTRRGIEIDHTISYAEARRTLMPPELRRLIDLEKAFHNNGRKPKRRKSNPHIGV